mgnify:CR=1 FL=1
MKGNDIRESYLSFLKIKKDHLRLKSFSLIPKDDPSLLLIGAGMAPLKPFFTGKVEPPRHRITTSQKCIRTGDIENVGYTARHHTFFEMLGNFSFGDYFKKEAISWAWEFLTEVIKLDSSRLYVTIYPDDKEAYDYWHTMIGLPENHIYPLADNFWEIGEGPCGPDSEIFFDQGEEFGTDPEIRWAETVIVSLKSGTWYSASMTVRRMAPIFLWQRKTLIPVQVWNVLQPYCSTRKTISKQTCSSRLLKKHLLSPVFPMERVHRAMLH